MNPLDQEERKKAVEFIDKCICVDAGAGTGKTTLLTERLMNLILSGTRLRNIAAITFTEKAAGELKLRVYEKLEEKLADCQDEKEEKILKTALQDLEVSQISTIHSFAANILRTRPVEASVDPNFSVIDEQQAYLLAEEVWKRWLVENFTEEDWVLGFGVSLGLEPKNLRSLASALYLNRDVLSFLDAVEPDYHSTQCLVDNTKTETEKNVLELENMMRNLLGISQQEPRQVVISALEQDKCKASEQIAMLLSLWDTFERSRKDLDFLDFAFQFAKYHQSKNNRPTAAKNWKWGNETNQKQQKLRTDLLNRVNQFIQDIGKAISPGLIRRIHSYIKKVDSEKERLGVLDFHDLLLWARNLLKDDRKVREFFQREYSHILVDEFQDTDPLQAEIIFFLCEDGAKAKEWHEVQLKPGKLFIVGDPKQSIYRFRRADIEIYDRAKSIIGEGSTLTISQNFRSVEPIINWVNGVFQRIMLPCGEDVFQAEYKPIACSREDTTKGVEVYSMSGEFTLTEIIEPVAEFIAQKIEKLVRSGLEVKKNSGEKGPVSYGDICIMFRKLTDVRAYENALNRHRIPYRTEGGKSFFSRQEIMDLRNMLLAIDNPYDEVAIVGTLRSALFSISDMELAKHRQAGKSFNYYMVFDEKSRIDNALKILLKIHRSRYSKPLNEIVWSLFEETKILQKHALFDQSLQSCTNLLRLVEMVNNMAGESAVQLSDAVRWLNLMTDQEMGMDEVPPEEGGAEFVQLMSIHKAKGLEFPVVFIAATGKARRNEPTELIVRHSAMKAAFKVGKIESNGYSELEQWERASQEAEECRLFYVGTTRAKELLCLFDLSKTKAKNHMWYQEMLNKALDLCEPFKIEVEASAFEPSKEQPEKQPEEPADTAAIEAIEKNWVASLELAFKRGSSKVSFESATEYEKAPPAVKKPYWDGVEFSEAVTLGSAFHELMERIPFDADSKTVKETLEAVVRTHALGAHADKLEHLCMNVMSSPIWERAKNAPRAFREMPFTVSRNGTMMTGYIDLLIEEENGAVIVDYKSDNVSEEAVRDRADFYRQQGEFYREAMERAGISVKDVIFFFAAPGVPVSFST